MYVIGTAGHVDHGKSALVRALTGIDPDRLQEEKDRGMTIDLGFAWLKLPSGREISIVDVPGHERFIKNMLAGVGGIDLALLVIAADEGVMPQTREHLSILDLLAVKNGICVITKKDLVDDDWLELVVADVHDTLKDTNLKNAPIVAVSSITAEGLPELLALIDSLLEKIPPKKDIGRPRLPIDRVFTIAGFGTVVTGTLIDGSLNVGQEIEILPRRLRSRIRGIQTHKQKVDVATPGTRVAANVANLAITDLSRGDVITSVGWLNPTSAVDVQLRVVPNLSRALQHNTPITFHTGASEVPGTVRLLERPELPPGQTSWAQIKLDEPVAVVKGDFFIIRSPNETIGGGEIVEVRAKRHRRFHVATLESLSLLQKGSPDDLLLTAIRRGEPVEVKALYEASGLAKAAPAVLDALMKDGRALVLQADQQQSPLPTAFVFSTEGWLEFNRKVSGYLGAYHRQFPLRGGMPKEELKSRTKFSSRLFGEALARLASEGIVAEGETAVRLPKHEVRLVPAQQLIVDRFLQSLEANPYSPPGDSLPEPDILGVLIEQGRIVKVDEGIFFAASAYRDMVDRIAAFIRTNSKISVAEARDLFHTSRKYALAFLEHLDERRVTRRVGDDRVLR